MQNNILIVGAGIFGCTLALELANRNASVTLIEKNDDILTEASFANQWRLHRGFHYPRSSKTIKETKAATLKFEAKFPDAVLSHFKNRYAIASKGSKIGAEQYESVLRSHNLSYRKVVPPNYLHNTDFCIETEENSYSPTKLKKILKSRLIKNHVKTEMGQNFDWSMMDNFDAVVLCAYGGNDLILRQGGFQSKRRFRVQLVEKPIVEMPTCLREESLVVLDGDYFSMDPLDQGDLSVIGHVTEAVHWMEDGCDRVNPSVYDMLAHQKRNQKKNSRFPQIIDAIRPHIPEVTNAKHVGSLWAVRTVPGNAGATDERPTMVERHSEKVFSIFSGKVSSCATSYEKLSALDCYKFPL